MGQRLRLSLGILLCVAYGVLVLAAAVSSGKLFEHGGSLLQQWGSATVVVYWGVATIAVTFACLLIALRIFRRLRGHSSAAEASVPLWVLIGLTVNLIPYAIASGLLLLWLGVLEDGLVP